MGEKKQAAAVDVGRAAAPARLVQPRVGFAYSLDDRTVVRGGYGVYYTQLENDAAHQSNLNIQTIIPEVAFDGRGDFPMNPWGGAFPSFDQAQQRLCSYSLTPGCIRREIISEIPTTMHDDTYSHQAHRSAWRASSGNDLALEVSYQFTGQRREEVTSNQNLTYDPATGDPVPFSNIAARVYPEWGYVNGEYMQGWSNWHAFVTSVTKRFSDRWQFSGNYTFGAVKDSVGPPCQTVRAKRRGQRSPLRRDPVRVGARHRGRVHVCRDRSAPSRGGQRHLGRRTRIPVERPLLLRLGHAHRRYLLRRASRSTTACPAGTRRRDDGSIIERNSFVGDGARTAWTCDSSSASGWAATGRSTASSRCSTCSTTRTSGRSRHDVSSPDYGKPVYNPDVAYGARSAQLGFRFAF